MSNVSFPFTGPDPFTSPDTFDSFQAGNLTWFSKVEVHKPHRPYKWHKKSAAGQEGATQTYRGKSPPKFEVDFYLWTTGHFLNWYLFQQQFSYTGVIGKVIPVQVYHPTLAMVGINEVVCTSLGAPERVSDDGMWRAKVELEEYFPPLPAPANVTPVAAATISSGFNIPVNPQVAILQAQVADLYALIKQNGTAAGLPP
jgi:hypothetical protein